VIAFLLPARGPSGAVRGWEDFYFLFGVSFVNNEFSGSSAAIDYTHVPFGVGG
jgi:hypothetical protein